MSALALTPAENEAVLSQLTTSGALDDPAFNRSYGVGKTADDVTAYLNAWKTAHGIAPGAATLSSAQKAALGLSLVAPALETPDLLAKIAALPPTYPTAPLMYKSNDPPAPPGGWSTPEGGTGGFLTPDQQARVEHGLPPGPASGGNVTIMGNLDGGDANLGSLLTFGPGGALDTGHTSGPTGLTSTTGPAAVAASGGLSPMILLALAAVALYFLVLRK